MIKAGPVSITKPLEDRNDPVSSRLLARFSWKVPKKTGAQANPRGNDQFFATRARWDETGKAESNNKIIPFVSSKRLQSARIVQSPLEIDG